MGNTSDDTPTKLIKENGFSQKFPQIEINKKLELNFEEFSFKKRLEEQTVNTETSLELCKSDSQIKNKFKTFYDTNSKDEKEFENSQLNEKCFSDYKKVKENLISIDEFVLNLKKYKENFNKLPISLNRQLEVPITLPSIKEVIFHEKPIENLELPLEQLKISSNDYALNKEETERIQKNLPLFYNLLFKKDGKSTDDQNGEENSSTGTIKSE